MEWKLLTYEVRARMKLVTDVREKKAQNKKRMKGKNRPRESKSMTENKEKETVMMYWEALNDFPKKEPHEGMKNEGGKPIGKMPKNHEEQHVEPTLNTGNQLKILSEEFSWETEDNRSTLDTKETEQQNLVYITNHKGGLQKDGTKLYNEEGPNNKKPAAKNRHFEEPTLNNLNHVYELYKESGSDNKNIEEIVGSHQVSFPMCTLEVLQKYCSTSSLLLILC